jgi:aryl-alcohol dehydrogenase-like predicted oxidoreductase
VIPGASRVEQIESNLAAADLRELTVAEMDSVATVYERYIKPSVHHLW